MSSIETKKKKARLKLFRQSIGLVFFGNLAYKFQWDIHEMPDNMEGYIQYDIKNLDKSEDGIIHINESFATKSDYNHNNMIALIIHEELHILNKHGLRRGQRDPKQWNVACDHVVDRDLREINETIEAKDRVHPYQNRYNIIEELHKQQPKCTAEQAYKWIQSNSTQMTIKLNSDGKTLQVTDQDGNSWTVNMHTGGTDQSETMTQEEKSKYQGMTEQLLSYARALHETMKQKGVGGNKLATYLDGLLKVEIPWESLLEKAIKTNTIMKPDERSWRCLNKFFYPHGLTLPGYSYTEDDEGVGLLIITVDTSGSISKEELKKFSSVIVQSMKYFKQIKVIVHDDPVHQIKDFYADNIREFYSFVKTEGFQGRGGTSHDDCYKEIEDLWEDNSVKDELSMVISLTDGYSDLPQVCKKYRWIKNNTPLVITLTNSWTHDFQMDNISLIYIK